MVASGHRRVLLRLAGAGGFLLAGPLLAQSAVPTVLAFPANVRAAGLAGAGVAMIGYAGSVFNNPSGLAPIRHLSLEASVARLPDRSTYTMGAAAVRLGPLNLGGGYQYLRLPKGQATYDNLTSVGTLVYRRGGLALGGSGKYVSVEDSAGRITRGVTSDLGFTVAFFDIAALALAVQNLGDWAISRGGFDLPRALHLGFSLNLLDTYSNGRLLATLETTWAQGSKPRRAVGLEGGAVFYGLGVVARIGTGSQPADAAGRFSRTAYGGGLVLGRARLDYAYQGRSPLGRSVHLFGFRWTP